MLRGIRGAINLRICGKICNLKKKRANENDADHRYECERTEWSPGPGVAREPEFASSPVRNEIKMATERRCALYTVHLSDA